MGPPYSQALSEWHTCQGNDIVVGKYKRERVAVALMNLLVLDVFYIDVNQPSFIGLSGCLTINRRQEQL